MSRAMRTALLLFIAALASCGAQQESPPATPAPAPQPVASYGYRVVATYPHDPAAFTQGLIYRGGVLIEGTGQEGQSSIRKVELRTGQVLQKRDLEARHFGEGITDWDGRLYQLTWRSQTGFIYDIETFEPVREWSYRGEGWGLTRNDEFIIMSDGTADLRFLNPETLEEDHRITVTLDGRGLPNLNELEWIDGEIWANVWTTDLVVRIDPETGRVLGRIDLSGLLTSDERIAFRTDVLNGVAYDAEGGRIFVTGKYWPKLFEIELVEH
jgi:glutamine cyclotransferase